MVHDVSYLQGTQAFSFPTPPGMPPLPLKTLESERPSDRAVRHDDEGTAWSSAAAFNVQTSGGAQLRTLLWRAWREAVRNPGVYWIRLVMYAMLCFMIGTNFLSLKRDDASVLQRTSMLYYVAALYVAARRGVRAPPPPSPHRPRSLVFMSIAVLPFLIMSRQVYVREVTARMYGPAVYQASVMLAALPALVVIAVSSSLLVYLLAGLRSGAVPLLVFTGNLLLTLVGRALAGGVLPTGCAHLSSDGGRVVRVHAGRAGAALHHRHGGGRRRVRRVHAGAGLHEDAEPHASRLPSRALLRLPHVHLPNLHGERCVRWPVADGRERALTPLPASAEFRGMALDASATRFVSGDHVLRLYDMEDASLAADFAVLGLQAVVYQVLLYLALRWRARLL